MLCVEIQGGKVVEVVPQPNNPAGCAYVLLTGGEVATNPLLLTAEDGAQIASAILLVWGVGFVWRALIKTLHGDERHENDS